jgi:adenine phosphoribosyltransferase
MSKINLKDYILDVPNFPVNGVGFKDITNLIKDPAAFREAIKQLAALYKNKGITKVAGIESRGFFFAPALALELGAGFVPIRKKGKLPRETISESYVCEYSQNTIEIHKDAFVPGDKVLLLDDVLATGGTAAAAVALVKKLGVKPAGFAFLLELAFLDGRKLLADTEVISLIKYL